MGKSTEISSSHDLSRVRVVHPKSFDVRDASYPIHLDQRPRSRDDHPDGDWYDGDIFREDILDGTHTIHYPALRSKRRTSP